MLFSDLFLRHKRRKNGELGGPVREKDLERKGTQAQEPQEEGSAQPSTWGSACEAPGATPTPALPHQPHGGAWLGLCRRPRKENRGQRADCSEGRCPKESCGILLMELPLNIFNVSKNKKEST